MKDIVIISNYIHFQNELGNSRFIYLANKIKDKEKVEIITSTFYHKTKTHRKIEDCVVEGCKVKLVHEPGYKKNISIKRIYSNNIIANNIIKYLEKRKKPDIIYCAVPPTIIGKKVAKFCKKNNIRFIIDIQDLWPEAYKMIFKIPVISDILFFPIKLQADYTYKNCDDIIAVSDTYLQRASQVNKKAKNKISVFLGTDLTKFDKYRKKKNSSDDEIKIVYLGTLGHSYDLECIMNAIEKIKEHKVKFIVLGDGVLRQRFETYAKSKNINCEFTGNLPYPQMVEKLCECDIAVNPIKPGSAGSIINKVGDYAAAGLPVINTQDCREYMDIVEKYDIGYNCQSNQIEEIAKKIEYLILNKEIRTKKGENNRKIAEEKFERNITYNQIVDLIRGE